MRIKTDHQYLQEQYDLLTYKFLEIANDDTRVEYLAKCSVDKLQRLGRFGECELKRRNEVNE